MNIKDKEIIIVGNFSKKVLILKNPFYLLNLHDNMNRMIAITQISHNIIYTNEGTYKVTG
jgi:hypothetical protein